MKRKGYDVKLVTEWKCPEGGGAPIIAMPNIPKPLHLVNPRNLLGKKTWDIMRKSCYAKADLTCEICWKTISTKEFIENDGICNQCAEELPKE